MSSPLLLGFLAIGLVQNYQDSSGLKFVGYVHRESPLSPYETRLHYHGTPDKSKKQEQRTLVIYEKGLN